jgi:hypothetical protein
VVRPTLTCLVFSCPKRVRRHKADTAFQAHPLVTEPCLGKRTSEAPSALAGVPDRRVRRVN